MDYVWHSPKPLSPKEIEDNPKLFPIVLQILKNRGIIDKKDIDSFIVPSSSSPSKYSPSLLKDMDKAVDRIIFALNNDEYIAVYGDYDADGVTSSSLLYLFFVVYSYFRKQSVKLKVFLPDRIKDGYGLKEGGVDRAIDLDAKLIITLDNGMSSHKAVDYANSEGIDVIIIDHHSIPDVLPSAYAIINPKQRDCSYPYKGFSAVALVYKLSEVLGGKLLEEKEREQFLKRYIDLVCIGTYQDLAPLVGENRYFVSEGIRLIEEVNRTGKTNLSGILELLKISGKNNHSISENTIGFVIGPLLNAAGRIASPNLAFDLLTTRKKDEAKRIASSLFRINKLRKEMTIKAVEEAIDYIDGNNLSKDKVILLVSSIWHQGIIGLVAQQIMNLYKSSCIVVSNRDSDVYTGSARAYGSFNIGSLVSSLKEHFIYSGGHTKAAGFSLKESNFEAFKRAFYEIEKDIKVSEKLELKIDAVLKLKDINISLIREIEQLSPFGASNPIPIFAIYNVFIKSIKASRRDKDTLLILKDETASFSLVAFNEKRYISQFSNEDMVDVAFNIDKDIKYNNIRGQIIDMKYSQT